MMKAVMPLFRCCLVLCLVASIIKMAAAQEVAAGTGSDERYINLDTPAVPVRGQVSFLGDLRAFGAQEDLVYGTLQLGYGLHDDWEIVVRSAFSSEKSYAGPGFTIRHGGYDIEALAKYRSPQHPSIGATLGISFPNDPAQKNAVLTGQLLYERALGRGFSILFVPKAAFIRDDPLIGIGGGLTYRFNDQVQLLGDITGIVAGNNTYSIYGGDRIRGEVWGVALRFTPRSTSATQYSVDVGVTNGLGGTTGFSMTPGLSGSTAFYLGLSCRR